MVSSFRTSSAFSIGNSSRVTTSSCTPPKSMIAMPVHSFVDLADSRRGKYRSAPRVGIWGEHPVGRSGAGQNHVGRRGGRDRAEAWTLRRRIDDAERLWLGVERLAGGREDRQLVALN